MFFWIANALLARSPTEKISEFIRSLSPVDPKFRDQVIWYWLNRSLRLVPQLHDARAAAEAQRHELELAEANAAKVASAIADLGIDIGDRKSVHAASLNGASADGRIDAIAGSDRRARSSVASARTAEIHDEEAPVDLVKHSVEDGADELDAALADAVPGSQSVPAADRQHYALEMLHACLALMREFGMAIPHAHVSVLGISFLINRRLAMAFHLLRSVSAHALITDKGVVNCGSDKGIVGGVDFGGLEASSCAPVGVAASAHFESTAHREKMPKRRLRHDTSDAIDTPFTWENDLQDAQAQQRLQMLNELVRNMAAVVKVR